MTSFGLDLDRDAFRSRLADAFHPDDHEIFDRLLPGYFCLYNLVRHWRPHIVVEIGVRAGYSALSFCLADSDLTLIGIDADGDEQLVNTHGGRRGLWQHACQILQPFDFHLILANSHYLQRLPRADLIYADGDHSFSGCLADLNFAQASADRILVDDYDGISDVAGACHAFLTTHPQFRGTRHNNEWVQRQTKCAV